MPVTPCTPRHATVPVRATRAGNTDDEIKAPGLAAMLRRSPHRVRQAAAAAIGAGLVLFVVTSVASAATHPAAPQSQAAAPVADATRRRAPPAAGAAGRGPAARPGRPHAGHQRVAAKNWPPSWCGPSTKAPATKQVITGLAANGIPNVALNAYRVAAARMAHDEPSCGIDWAMLAGIGREESDHGRFAGAVLNADGTSTPRIIGPALDGTHSDYIAAPANGYALDGDAKYTHALGPMQFIPQTWASYGVDANGDGKADIFNINDAALGAARYLCAAGGDLRTQSGRVRAVLAYNHNDQYLAQVLALAQAYRSGRQGHRHPGRQPDRRASADQDRLGPGGQPGHPDRGRPHRPVREVARQLAAARRSRAAPAARKHPAPKPATTPTKSDAPTSHHPSQVVLPRSRVPARRRPAGRVPAVAATVVTAAEGRRLADAHPDALAHLPARDRRHLRRPVTTRP